jgi:hypothetical protein
MIAETIPALNDLTSDQKIILAAELWRDAIGNADATPNPEILEALRERLEFHRAHPNNVSTWHEVRARIMAKKSGNG